MKRAPEPRSEAWSSRRLRNTNRFFWVCMAAHAVLLVLAISDRNGLWITVQSFMIVLLMAVKVSFNRGTRQNQAFFAEMDRKIAALEAIGRLQAVESSEPPHIVCPRCHKISYNPNDIEHRYCANCHHFHDDPEPEPA